MTASRSEMDARLDRVAQAMLEHGCWNGRIEAAFAEEWGVSRRQVRNYVARAKELIRDELEEAEGERAERRRFFMARLRAGQREMLSDRNWPAWVKAMSLEAKVSDLEAATQVRVESAERVSPEVSDQLADALGMDRAKLRKMLGASD